MGSPVKTYQAEMHDNLGFYATWLPSDRIDVGDVGFFEGGRFRKIESLEDLGVQCNVAVNAGKADMQFTSRDGVHLDASGGAAAAIAQIGLSIKFSRAGSFLFHVNGMNLRRLENRSEIARWVLLRYAEKKWKKDWLIVESVHTAERATVIISEDENATIQLTAESSLPLSALSLAAPKLQLSVAAMKGKLFQMLSVENVQPLYSCLRVKEPFFGEAELTAIRGSDNVRRHFGRPAIRELLES